MSLRLAGADFDAFAGDRPGGARARVELRQRVLSWARGVVARLAALGLNVTADEHPRPSADLGSLRVAFLRDADARAEIERTLAASVAKQLTSAGALDHVCFALAIDAASVAVSVELSPLARLDAKNLHARLADPALAADLARALEALPEQFSFALTSSIPARVPAAVLDRPPESEPVLPAGEPDLARALGRVLARAEDRLSPLWIGWRIPRAIAVLHSAVLDEQLEDAIVALAGVYELIAWAPDNDLVKVAREYVLPAQGRDSDDPAWEKRDRARARAKRRAPRHGAPKVAPKQSARKKGEEPASRRARDESARGPSSGRGAARPGAQVATAAIAGRGREGRRVTAREPAGQPAGRANPVPGKAARSAKPLLHATLRPGLHTLPRPGLRTTRPAAHEGAGAGGVVGRGTRVRVLSGPFMDKIGVVQELDGKGRARVMLGLLATRLDVKDLVVSTEGRERPSLSSSHRKLTPPVR